LDQDSWIHFKDSYYKIEEEKEREELIEFIRAAYLPSSPYVTVGVDPQTKETIAFFHETQKVERYSD